MNARTIVPVGLMVMLAFYGLLKAVVLFILVSAGIFAGSVLIFGIHDAIRTRNELPARRTRPQRRKVTDDAELAQLRHMAGL
jgi:hypothetical protein